MIDKSIYRISIQECSGCKMCGDICPKEAISFDYKKGFWYPSVDDKKCVNCGLCSNKCPSLHNAPKTPPNPFACYGAKSKDETIRENSTSGGFFTELAQYTIENGGYVIAALYDDKCRIVHASSNIAKDIERFRQSKYAQSDTSGIYKITKQLLVRGEKVLFCGTACQVEALYSFLGKEYVNLQTMDFICLGICSPFAYRKYLDMLESKYKAKAVKVWFKNKTHGWRSISTRIDFSNGKVYLEPGYKDLFMHAFVVDALSMRPNCQYCKFRKIPHHSDFTVADFWGIEHVNPAIDDNKGLSAIFVNSESGQETFIKISKNLDYFETTAENICNGNFSTLRPMAPHPKYGEFMTCLENHSFKAAMKKYSSYKSRMNLKAIIKKCISILVK